MIMISKRGMLKFSKMEAGLLRILEDLRFEKIVKAECCTKDRIAYRFNDDYQLPDSARSL